MALIVARECGDEVGVRWGFGRGYPKIRMTVLPRAKVAVVVSAHAAEIAAAIAIDDRTAWAACDRLRPGTARGGP